MDFSSFIKDNTASIVPALYILGTLLKRIKFLPCYLIPYILMGTAIALCVWILGFTPTAIIQGILTAGGAVLVNECKKQAGKARSSNNKKKK